MVFHSVKLLVNTGRRDQLCLLKQAILLAFACTVRHPALFSSHFISLSSFHFVFLTLSRHLFCLKEYCSIGINGNLFLRSGQSRRLTKCKLLAFALLTKYHLRMLLSLILLVLYSNKLKIVLACLGNKYY
jgi:hypothetical protein